MPISITKYVDSRTGVAAGAAVRARELIGRVLSTSSVLQPGVVVEFDSLDDVGSVFATNSPEYIFASKYFGFVSKDNGGASKLSMSRWAKAAVAAQITGGLGAFGATTLTSLQNATDLTLRVTDAQGIATLVEIEVDLTAALTYDAVRSALQTAIRAQSNPLLTQANVLYTAATGVFTFQSGAASTGGKVEAVAQSSSSADVAYWINWLSTRGAVVSAQVNAQTPVEAIDASAKLSDNFGSFGFLDSSVAARTPLELDDLSAVAQWTHAQNVKFMFCALGTIPDAQEIYNENSGYSGLGVSLAMDDFAEFVPMIVLASVNYDNVNASTNYMYQTFDDMVPSVDETTISDAMDAVRMNYIGSAQQAGQALSFYQRGVLMGGPTAPVDMATFCNEIWLKDQIVTNYLSMLLTLNRVPANDAGRGIVLTNLQVSIDAALNNGVISVGKLLSNKQKQAITQMTGDNTAWMQVQTAGYVTDVTIKEVTTTDGRTEYVAVYQLIYAKDDQIRKVEGTNTLI